ncbi:hypothetical protein CYME_CME014C [Cyanidioschyzon merolae strain 10D]|uniref:Uncharacterized protein n=1 Tax=Cyanidioschyzon merolae (strain NIES-3377 / 10D) TaxID=280699 RepID=M1VAR4_CYAM1|nr:hypothetical protein CYME_CME014C [Cyanidioschyzon merolae strain 10D]BAM79252.1 hypothetical protein CYME_CME014C [Cyanidioschyzon merolae strain 10D]|eukprot:XP_005535538.1 hypothetical protein CYME_CME014C [Cyanidioschyzon merolae strain 10D]
MSTKQSSLVARAYFGRNHRPKVFNWKTFRGIWVKERRKKRITLEYSSLPSAQPLNSGTWFSGHGATAALLTSLSLGMLFFSLRTILRG